VLFSTGHAPFGPQQFGQLSDVIERVNFVRVWCRGSSRRRLVVGINGGQNVQKVLDLNVSPSIGGQETVDKERSVLLVRRNQIGKTDRCVRFRNLKGR